MPVYTVKYEIELFPSPVIIELVCKSEEEMKEVYESRRTNGNCKRVTQNITE